MQVDGSNDQWMRTQWRTELYRAKTKKSKYKEKLEEPRLLSRWPKFLRLDKGRTRVGQGFYEGLRLCEAEGRGESYEDPHDSEDVD